MNPELYTRSVY